AALFWAVVTPPWRIAAAHYSPALWARFALLGVFSTLVPFRCFYAGLKLLPATEAGVISTSEPVVAILSAALFLGESLRPLQMVGAGIDRKSTRLNSSHLGTSYAVFCLKK